MQGFRRPGGLTCGLCASVELPVLSVSADGSHFCPKTSRSGPGAWRRCSRSKSVWGGLWAHLTCRLTCVLSRVDFHRRSEGRSLPPKTASALQRGWSPSPLSCPRDPQDEDRDAGPRAGPEPPQPGTLFPRLPLRASCCCPGPAPAAPSPVSMPSDVLWVTCVPAAARRRTGSNACLRAFSRNFGKSIRRLVCGQR